LQGLPLFDAAGLNHFSQAASLPRAAEVAQFLEEHPAVAER